MCIRDRCVCVCVNLPAEQLLGFIQTQGWQHSSNRPKNHERQRLLGLLRKMHSNGRARRTENAICKRRAALNQNIFPNREAPWLGIHFWAKGKNLLRIYFRKQGTIYLENISEKKGYIDSEYNYIRTEMLHWVWIYFRKEGLHWLGFFLLLFFFFFWRGGRGLTKKALFQVILGLLLVYADWEKGAYV